MDEKSGFIMYLEGMKEERGKMASLRRGLGMRPGTCAAMYPIVAPRLPRSINRDEEERYYLVAALFGSHPVSTHEGNMGDHLRKTCGSKITPAAERRFKQLLSTHWEELPDQLRQVVSLLRSNDTAINWQRLFHDLHYWDHPERFVQRQWANAFWGYDPDQDKNDNA